MALCPLTTQTYPSRMSKSARIKAEVTWLKVLCGTLFALNVSLVSWLVQNFEATARVIIIGGCIFAIILACAVVAAFVRVYCCILSMEAL